MSARTPEKLREFLELVWSAETSATPDAWSTAKPSTGQCAVTALVVQDEFGGYLLRCLNGEASHYYNVLDDGTVCDLTRDQFPTWHPSRAHETRKREELLASPDTRTRYALLRLQLDELL